MAALSTLGAVLVLASCTAEPPRGGEEAEGAEAAGSQAAGQESPAASESAGSGTSAPERPGAAGAGTRPSGAEIAEQLERAQAEAAAPPANPPARQGLDPAEAAGESTLVIALGRPLRLGGFELAVRFEADAYAAEDPEATDLLKGYLCAANTARGGEIRYNCAGIAQAEVEGVLARVPLHYREDAPTVADLEVVKAVVVDEYGSRAENVPLELRIE